MSKTSYKVYVGEVGSAYTDKVQTAADYAAAQKNVEDANALIEGANAALTSAQNALTDAQAAMTEVKKAKLNASAALSNLESTVATTEAAYRAAIEHSDDASQSSAIEAAKTAYEAAVLAYDKFNAILTDTDADLPSKNSEDNYEDLLATTIAEIEAIIVRAQSVVEEAQAYKEKAEADAENYKTLSEEAKDYFESLLPEDMDNIPANDENDNIEREIQAKIDAVNSDIADARGIIDMINESTDKINNGIQESGNTPADPSEEDSDEPIDTVKLYAYAGLDAINADNFSDKAVELTEEGYNKSFSFAEAMPIYIAAPVSGAEISGKTNVAAFGEVDVEFEPESTITVNDTEYALYMVELTDLTLSIKLV